jgi:hypothetical protein
MPRKNSSANVRRYYEGEVRDSERDRRRKRLAQRTSHPNRNVKKESYPYAP